MDPAHDRCDWLEWGVALRALPGEPETADAFAVAVVGERAVVAVADGLGHGFDAACAAKEAVSVVRDHASEPVVKIFEHCHAALAGMRGAVLSLVALDHANQKLEWLGVGDVEVALHSASGRRRETLMLRGGVVGDRIPPLRVAELPLARGDTLVLATDGIRRKVLEEPVLAGSPQELAERLLQLHGKATDDALVLIVRYKRV